MPYNVQIGDLKTRITFQQPSITVDPGAAQNPAWANVGTNPTVWSRWVYAHGDEVVKSEALQSVQRATVTVRYRTDISTVWRILKDGEAWLIRSVDFVQDANRWAEMIVERAKGTI